MTIFRARAFKLLVLAILAVAGCYAADQGAETMTRLSPCPDTPNCVSTLADDDQHGIAPLTFAGSTEDAKARLLTVIRDMPRTKIVEDDGDYVHVEFTSRIFRFVDDVEFLLDEDGGKIDFRSASRLGKGDLGANRKRMETVREAFSRAGDAER